MNSYIFYGLKVQHVWGFKFNGLDSYLWTSSELIWVLVIDMERLGKEFMVPYGWISWNWCMDILGFTT